MSKRFPKAAAKYLAENVEAAEMYLIFLNELLNTLKYANNFLRILRFQRENTFILFMPKRSAGILAYRFNQQIIEVLLVHPGGPFYAKKDKGVWSIPKGEYDETNDPLIVAKREFEEETGNCIIMQNFIQLPQVKLKSGKIISAWAVAENFEQCFIRSNQFEMEWPPKSGKVQSFPEVDKAAWLTLDEAIIKIHPAQVPLLTALQSILTSTS